LVVNNHEIFRRGLCGLIEEQPGWKVCATAANGEEAVKAAKRAKPDVVVIELSLPLVESLETVREIKTARPATEFVVLSAKESKEGIQDALDAGAKSYVRKSEAAEWLVPAIRSVASHQILLTPEIIDLAFTGAGSLAGRKSGPVTGQPLTAREKEVVRLLAQSHSNKEIAAELGVSLRTAEAHRANIMRKLGFRALADLVRYAIRNDIIEA
jgi:DNA-binding NarL/FixJ family response regulator